MHKLLHHEIEHATTLKAAELADVNNGVDAAELSDLCEADYEEERRKDEEVAKGATIEEIVD